MALAAEDLFRLGSGLLEEGNPIEAAHQLELAEGELRSDYDFSLTLGRAYMETGRLSEAEDRFRRCIETDADRPEAYRYAADLLFRQGKKQEAKKWRALAQGKLGQKPEPAEEAAPNWEPEASAIKASDIEFDCPNCENPVLHGSNDLTCPHCHQNLLPIRHGRIKPYWRLDGQQDFQCAQCQLPLTGKEMECPHCHTNLLTGEPPEPEKPLERIRAPRAFKSPKGLGLLVAGFLLLAIGIGQFRLPRTRQGAVYAWRYIGEKAHLVRSYEEQQEAASADLPEYRKNPVSIRGDMEMAHDFLVYFGVIVAGGLAVLLGGMKYYLDR
jgi:Zn finger protein HypA/HybF involved in hydrogenase expression